MAASAKDTHIHCTQVKSWDPDELASQLKNHVDEAAINLLKTNNVSGKDFLSLLPEDMKLFGFSLSHVCQIQRFKNVLISTESLNLTTQESSDPEISDAASTGIVDDGSSSSDSENFDSEVEPYVNQKDDLGTYSKFEKEMMAKKIRIYEAMVKQGLPATRPCYGPKTSRPKTKKPTNQGKRQKCNDNVELVQEPIKVPVSVQEVHVGDDTDTSGDDDNYVSAEAIRKTIYKPIAALLTKKEIEAMSPTLPSFDVENILTKDEKTKKLVPFLKEGYLVEDKLRKLMIRTLVRHLVNMPDIKHPKDIPAEAKEGMAKSLCVVFPQYQKAVDIPGRLPWSHVYFRPKSSGFIGNVMKRVHDRLPAAEKARSKKKKNIKKKPATCTVDVAALALIFPGMTTRDEIFSGMKNTFALRCEEREKGITISEMGKKYPQFFNFHGELISEEFIRMKPTAKDMCPVFQPLIPKIIDHFKDKGIKSVCKDKTIDACLILASLLPHPIRRGVPLISVPKEEDLITIIKTGIDVNQYVQERRDNQEILTPVQPYLLGVRASVSGEIVKFFLVIESRAMELLHIPTLRALDILFKSYFAFNVHYPPSWVNFFRFLQTCFYKVLDSDRDDIPPSAEELYRKIINL